MLNLKDYGAVGNGTTDDTNAINAWIAAMRSSKTEGYAPAGKYKATQRILFPQDGTGNGYKFHGDGAYKTLFDVSAAPNNQGPQVHFYTATGKPTSAYTSVSDVGFIGNTPNTLAAIGLDDFSDNIGNANFTNVYFGNTNTTGWYEAISLQLNYVFDSTFQNCVVVGKPNVGNALDLRSAVFCTFTGGSYSNAGRGIRIRTTNNDPLHYSICNTFIGADFENVNYAIVCEEPRAEANVFVTTYFDMWDPVNNVVPSGYAIYSSACGSRGLIVEHPYLHRGTLLDPNNRVNVTVRTP